MMCKKKLLVLISKLSQNGTSEVAATHQSGCIIRGQFFERSIMNGAFVFCNDKDVCKRGFLMIPFFSDLLVIFLKR